MKKFLLFLSCLPLLIGGGCSDYDDQPLQERVDDLENRVDYLESLCSRMNLDIASLQALVQVLQNNDTVQSVVPVVKDGKTIGYTITFTKSNAITIYNGEDGKDGADGKDGSSTAPVIGVAQYEGVWYWTINGVWLTTPDGEKVRAEGRDGADGKPGEAGQPGADGKPGEPGQDGKDGVTPQLKIEEGYWYISTDGGATWTQLGKATGEDGKDGADGAAGKDGDSLFSGIEQDDTKVTFTLADGTTIVIPKAQRLAIALDATECALAANVPVEIGYTLTGATESTQVEVMATGAVKARIASRTETSGIIKIGTENPEAIDEYDKVLVIAADGERSAIAAITFEQGILRVAEAFEAAAEGETVTVAVETNLDYTVAIEAAAQSWLTQVETRALRTDYLRFAVAANEGPARTGMIVLTAGDIERRICIAQASGEKLPAIYKIEIPDFATGCVQKAMAGDKQIAEVCLEYIRSGEIDRQMVVIYPMANGKADLKKGFSRECASVVWDSAANTCTVTGGNTAEVIRTTFYVTEDGTISESMPDYPATEVETTVEAYLLVDERGTETETYKIAKIGTQYWMAENLRTERYADGSSIPVKEWTATETAGACNYLFGERADNRPVYGTLYNGYAMLDERGLAPQGWEICTADDITKLKTYLGTSVVGTKLKSETGWSKYPGSNLTGFNAYPGMYYQPSTSAELYGGSVPEVYFWTTTKIVDPLNKNGISLAYYRLYDTNTRLTFEPNPSAFNVTCHAAAFGHYIRCIRK